MDIESKVWNWTRTGTVFHAFLNGEHAACRSSIKVPAGHEKDAATLERSRWVARNTPGVRVCTNCEIKFDKTVAAATPAEDALRSQKKETVTGSRTVEGTFHTYLKITPEVVEALAWLRHGWDGDNSERAITALGVLDSVGVFGPIDEAARAECTCPPSYSANDYHGPSCPQAPVRGEPAALRVKTDQPLPEGRRPCPADNCTLEFKVNGDGTLHKHLNDALRPCRGVAPKRDDGAAARMRNARANGSFNISTGRMN